MIVEVERNKLFIVIYIVETYTPEIPLTPWKQVLKKEIEPGVSKSVLQLVILLKREEKWYCVWKWTTKSQVMVYMDTNSSTTSNDDVVVLWL